MGNLYIDSNILIDFLRGRNEAEFRSGEFIRKAFEKNNLFISALTVHITMYVIRGDEFSREKVKNLFDLFEIVLLSGLDTKKALEIDFRDYEDVLQYLAAAKNCKVIITRDKKDFEKINKLVGKKMEILTPAEWLESGG